MIKNKKENIWACFVFLYVTVSLTGCAVSRVQKGSPQTHKQNATEQKSYEQSDRLLQAQALDDQGHFLEAEEIYKSVYQITDPTNSTLAIEAMYLLALNYQKRDEEVKALAMFADLESRSSRFPRKTLGVEIKARKMQIYTLRGQKKDADESLELAEAELKKILPTLSIEESERDLPQCYYFMGSVSLEKMTEKNILNYLNVFLKSQAYLFKAVQFEKSRWALNAKNLIFEHYAQFVHLFDLKTTQNIQVGAELLNLTHYGFLHLPQNQESQNQMQKEIFAFLQQINEHVEKVLYDPSARSPIMNRFYDIESH